MQCPRCKKRFPINWRNLSEFDSLETPGAIFVAIIGVVITGIIFYSRNYDTVAYGLYGFAGLLCVPWIMNIWNCRKCHCPNCSRKQRVYPWSM